MRETRCLSAAELHLIVGRQTSVFRLLFEGKRFEKKTSASGSAASSSSAVAVAWSEDESALLRKAVLVIRYLFWHGLRMQLVYDGEMASRRHERAADSDRITPMLAVVGLQPAQLQQHVDAVNAELRAAGTTDQKSQIDGLIELALVNGSVACTVCGLPRGLLALHARLSRTHAVGASAAATRYARII